MKGSRKAILWTATTLLLILSMALPWTAFAYVTTDKPDYSPGEVVAISGDNRNFESGAGYLPGETVHVDVVGPNSYTAGFYAAADANGAWSGQVTLWDNELAIGDYTYTATGLSSGVVEIGTFTDAHGDIYAAARPAGTTMYLRWYFYEDTADCSGEWNGYGEGTGAAIHVGWTDTDQSYKLVAPQVSEQNTVFSEWTGPNSETTHVAEIEGEPRAICVTQPTNDPAYYYAHYVAQANQPPTVTGVTVPGMPININDQASFDVDVTFTDPAGTADMPYTCEFDFDYDGTFASDVSVEAASYGSCSAALVGDTWTAYTEPGVYTVVVKVTDKDEASGSGMATEYIVIYDPTAGFVTGGGWIDSPEGAYTDDPSLTGKATFGFVSKYLKNATVPTGNTQFVFHAAGMNFHSSSYDWLVVNQNGTNAQYKGSGTVNGVGGYQFMLWATDGASNGSADMFRIKIWSGEDDVLYDNGFGQDIGGGSIVIHTGKK